jgi:DNA-binding transcriptional ArsR family regulator
VPVTKSTHKRYSQLQLTKIFINQADLPLGVTTEMRQRWWKNPTDPASLRLSLQGLQFVKAVLKIQSYEFALPEELTNHHLLKLERQFKGMYYLLKRQKIIVFEEEEAMMLTLHGNNLALYLDNIESTS